MKTAPPALSVCLIALGWIVLVLGALADLGAYIRGPDEWWGLIFSCTASIIGGPLLIVGYGIWIVARWGRDDRKKD